MYQLYTLTGMTFFPQCIAEFSISENSDLNIDGLPDCSGTEGGHWRRSFSLVGWRPSVRRQSLSIHYISSVFRRRQKYLKYLRVSCILAKLIPVCPIYLANGKVDMPVYLVAMTTSAAKIQQP